jgi:hypothetical protein
MPPACLYGGDFHDRFTFLFSEWDHARRII